MPMQPSAMRAAAVEFDDVAFAMGLSCMDPFYARAIDFALREIVARSEVPRPVPQLTAAVDAEPSAAVGFKACDRQCACSPRGPEPGTEGREPARARPRL